MNLREETYLRHGTKVQVPVHGVCRVVSVYPDKVSVVLGHKKLGACADMWLRRSGDRLTLWGLQEEAVVVE